MSQLVEKISHENGILEFIFHGEDRATVDEYFSILEAHMEAILANHGKAQVRILINFSQSRDLPPFAYLTSQGRKLLQKHHDVRDKIHMREAFLARQDEMLVLSLAETFIKMMPIDAEMKAFELSKRDEAIAWLLAK